MGFAPGKPTGVKPVAGPANTKVPGHKQTPADQSGATSTETKSVGAPGTIQSPTYPRVEAVGVSTSLTGGAPGSMQNPIVPRADSVACSTDTTGGAPGTIQHPLAGPK